MSNHKHSNERHFFPIRFFSHWAHSDSSFLGASGIGCLQMYHTNVLFGMPDHDQTLDMWESQTAESALRCTCQSTRRGHHLSFGLISWIPQDILVGICADILDYMYWNWGRIQFNDCPTCRTSYSMWLCSELMRYATSVLWVWHMGLGRILHNTCLSQLVGWGLVCFISKAYSCRKPPSYVLYKGTYVPYDGTFGTPD